MKRSQKSQKEGNYPKREKRTRNKKTPLYADEAARKTYMQCYLSSLIDDAVQFFPGDYGNADATRDKARLIARLESEGSSFATIVLPTLSTGLFDLKEHGSASFPQFSLLRGTVHPRFLGRLFNLALYSTKLKLRIKAVDFLYSFSTAFKKLKGDYPIKVIRKNFADFVKTDVELGSIDFFSKELRPYLEDARAQWRDFVKVTGLRSRIQNSTPQPGPGATNSPTKKSMRYRPHAFYKQINDVMPYVEWFYPTPWHVFNSESAFDYTYSTCIESPTARFKYVNKTVLKPRGICIEENETQCMQQAVRKAFYDAIADYFGDNIALRKQRVNALLALESSLTQKHATIDESEASDRIARLLVSWLSQDDVEVHNILMGLSTRWVIPPVELKDEYPGTLKTEKYAPMGSALCFPVMSLVHMFLIRAIIRLSTPYDTSTSCAEVYVYGDDIILPVKHVKAVYEWLPKFGMKINKGKSFFHSHFRESCGIHAYYGVDITPVYVKYIPFHRTSDAYASVFAVEEQLFNKGFTKTAEFQRATIDRAYGKNHMYVPTGLSLAGYARTYDTDSIEQFKKTQRRKWSRRFQCYKYTVTRFKKHVEKEKILDQLDAYTRWMWAPQKWSEGPEDSSGSLICETRTVLESALGRKTYSEMVFDLCKRFPTANARVSHSTRLGRASRYIATLGIRTIS